MKHIFAAAIACSLIVQPAFATPQNLYQLILSKCRIEFSEKVALEKAKFYTPRIHKYAVKYKLPPKIVAAVVWHESNYRPRCTSECGAIGLMQVVPFAGRFPRGSDPYDPDVNLDVGCRLLKGYLLKFNGDWNRALTAYNYGDGTVSRGMYRSSYSRAVLHSAGH